MTLLGTVREPRFARLRETRTSAENPSVPLNDARLIEILGGAKSSAGVLVNETSAMRLATVNTAVRILSETLASLPLQVYRRVDNGSELAPKHPYAYLLHDEPNPSTASFTWREVLMAHTALWGNHYSRLEWSNGGQLLGIYQLLPWQVQPYRKAGATRYRVQLTDGSEDLPAEEVLHVAGLGFDGLTGESVIRNFARNSVGLAIEAESFGARFFANDARPGIVLEHPGALGDPASKHLKESLSENFGGANRSKPMVLEEGMKLHEVGVPPEDAQFLETRKFQRSDILGIFRVPPHMAGDLEKATFSNIEQQDINFAKHTMLPWCKRVESELNRKIFGRNNAYYAEFNLDGLMRGDFKSRMEGYQIGVGGPFLTVNEARKLENRPPLPGGDDRLVPVNMAPVDKDGKPQSLAKSAPDGGAPDATPADTPAGDAA